MKMKTYISIGAIFCMTLLSGCDATEANKASKESSNPLKIYPESVKRAKTLNKDLAAQDKIAAEQAKQITDE